MITKTILRKGSTGIKGSLANAKHHATPCLPLIKRIGSLIDSLGEIYDIDWSQGNNVHVLTRNLNGDKLTFRPWHKDSNWGIDVLARFSRSQEMRLFTIRTVSECAFLYTFLDSFYSCPDNVYGRAGQENQSND